MEVLKRLIENERVDELLKVFSKLEGESIIYSLFRRIQSIAGNWDVVFPLDFLTKKAIFSTDVPNFGV